MGREGKERGQASESVGDGVRKDIILERRCLWYSAGRWRRRRWVAAARGGATNLGNIVSQRAGSYQLTGRWSMGSEATTVIAEGSDKVVTENRSLGVCLCEGGTVPVLKM